MDDARQSDGKAVTARVVRQFAPSRIERQLLAQVFDLVAHDQPVRTNVFGACPESHFSAAPHDIAEASVDARAMSRQRAGRAAA